MSSETDFNHLFADYSQSVYNFACYLTNNIQEAEDLFQDSWLKVVENMDHMDSIRDFKSWIFTIVANKYRDLLRKKKIREVFLLGKYLNTREVRYSVNETDSLDINMAVKQALAKLSSRQRAVFVLKEIEGYKHHEVSKILAVPVGTVKSLLHRAIKNMQKELAGYDLNKQPIEESRA